MEMMIKMDMISIKVGFDIFTDPRARFQKRSAHDRLRYDPENLRTWAADRIPQMTITIGSWDPENT